MKNNLTYYQHYCDSHVNPKFKLLRSLYGGGDNGWSAEGKFWALNNMIASSEQCILKINKKYVAASVALDLNFNLDEFHKFIANLVECELIINIGGDVTTDIVRDNLKEVLKEREKSRVRKNSKNEKQISNEANISNLFSIKRG